MSARAKALLLSVALLSPAAVITEEEFQRATVSLARDMAPVADPLEYARQLFEVPARSGWFFYDRRTKQLAPLDPAAAADFLPADVVELTRSYMQWCHNRLEPGDCLRLLRHGHALAADARRAVAMDIALGKGLANREAVYSLRDGWRRLVARADAAETFDELRAAGEQFWKLMGLWSVWFACGPWSKSTGSARLPARGPPRPTGL